MELAIVLFFSYEAKRANPYLFFGISICKENSNMELTLVPAVEIEYQHTDWIFNLL